MTPTFWRKFNDATKPYENYLGIGFLVLLPIGAYLSMFSPIENECALPIGISFVLASLICVGVFASKWWFKDIEKETGMLNTITEWYSSIFMTFWYGVCVVGFIMVSVGGIKKCIL